MKKCAKCGYENLDELARNPGKLPGLPTGITDLDNCIGGLNKSDLILLAARPGMGKTAFALNLASNAALRGKTGVAIFSLEMSKEQMVNRILCSEAMVDSNKVRTGKIEEDDWVKLATAPKKAMRN